MTHEGDVIDDVIGHIGFIGFFDEFFPFPPTQRAPTTEIFIWERAFLLAMDRK